MVRSVVAELRGGREACRVLARSGVMRGDEGRGPRCALRAGINAGRLCREGL